MPCQNSACGPVVPPGNRLEKLAGDRAGQYSIRVNQQWRSCDLHLTAKVLASVAASRAMPDHPSPPAPVGRITRVAVTCTVNTDKGPRQPILNRLPPESVRVPFGAGQPQSPTAPS